MRLFIIIAALLVIYFALRILYQRDPKSFTRKFIKYVLFTVVGLLIFLAVTGRLHWLFALVGALLPWANRLIGLLPVFRIFQGLRQQSTFQNQRGSSSRSSGQSGVTSHYLNMVLNHQDGSMAGEVLAGRFAGRELRELQIPELKILLSECQADQNSLSLLTAYLEHRFGADWHIHFDVHGHQGQQHGDSARGGDAGEMSKQEAGEILGVGEEADKEEIILAHRRLMQKFHPDRGGSDYLAAKINQAKETLLS